MIKKILLSIWLIVCSLYNFYSFAAPSFYDLSQSEIWWYKSDLWVSANNSFYSNLVNLFFPSGNGWYIRTKLQIIFLWLLFIFVIRAWSLFVLWANDDWNLKKAKNNLLYILYWAFLVFGAIWILWTVLKVWISGTTASATVVNVQHNIIWNILIFFKSVAYYAAVIFIVYYGYSIMQAHEKEDKIKAARTWAINVIIALISIKVLDYVYYIAQWWNFRWNATSFIASLWTVLGWVLWVLIILVLIYSGFLLITSRWNEESMKKSITIIKNVFLVIFVLFLFIIIVYDFVKNLT